jgi:hypothetical protein
MPLCTVDRWGKGTPPKTESSDSSKSSKEMEEKLKKMQEEREKMDANMYPKTK